MNNQFLHLQGKVYKRYVKTVLSVLSGTRPDPDDLRIQRQYTLKTLEDFTDYKPTALDAEQVEAVGRLSINYDTEVLEVYSEQEDMLFRRMNKQYIEEGLLIEYKESIEPINTENELPDAQLREIADIRNHLQFKARISKITSMVTLKRLNDMLDSRPRIFQKHVEERMKYVT